MLSINVISKNSETIQGNVGFDFSYDNPRTVIRPLPAAVQNTLLFVFHIDCYSITTMSDSSSLAIIGNLSVNSLAKSCRNRRISIPTVSSLLPVQFRGLNTTVQCCRFEYAFYSTDCIPHPFVCLQKLSTVAGTIFHNDQIFFQNALNTMNVLQKKP